VHLKKYPVIAQADRLVYTAQSTWTYFTMEKCHWDAAEIGYSLGHHSSCAGRPDQDLVSKIGRNNAVNFGLILYVIGFFLFSIANKGWTMYAILIPYALGALQGLQGIISNPVPASEQGERQGRSPV
jgi:DHA1 family tetracycline resistance protein-like MFS transporter